MLPLDMKSSVMKHVTVTRILLIFVLGCAAVSVHLAFQVKNECMCTNENPQHVIDVRGFRLNTSLFPSVNSTTPHEIMHALSSIKRDYHKYASHRSIIETTTTAVVDQPRLKSTEVHMPFTFHELSTPMFRLPASADVQCLLPLFCSSKVVRNCVTNDIIGRVPDAIRSQQMKPSTSRSIETSHMRRQSFNKVFDSRAWGHDWDSQHRGLNASGVY